jgi:hypothetical protein
MQTFGAAVCFTSPFFEVDPVAWVAGFFPGIVFTLVASFAGPSTFSLGGTVGGMPAWKGLIGQAAPRGCKYDRGPLLRSGKEGPARPRSSDPLMVKEFRKKPTNLSIKLSRWRALDAIRHGAER